MRKFENTYSDLWNNKIELTAEELAYFHGVVATFEKYMHSMNYHIEITNRDHENMKGKSKEALGIFYTNNKETPYLDDDCFITIDNYFIHEKYKEEIKGEWTLEPQSLAEVIAHEIAHRFIFRHGRKHRETTSAILAAVAC